jgi:hypothetical protein
MSTEDMRDIFAFFKRFQGQSKNEGKSGQEEESSDHSGDDGVDCTLQHFFYCFFFFVFPFFVELDESSCRFFLDALRLPPSTLVIQVNGKCLSMLFESLAFMASHKKGLDNGPFHTHTHTHNNPCFA